MSSLSPNDITGLSSLAVEIWSSRSLSELIANTPSGQLLFGNNPRVTNFLKRAAQFSGVADYGMGKQEFSDVAISFAKIASGFSNYWKAKYALDYGRTMNSYGDSINDPDVNHFEAMAQMLGIGTKTQAMSYITSKRLYEESEASRNDAKEILRLQNLAFGGDKLTEKHLDSELKRHNFYWRVFPNNEKAHQMYWQEARKDISTTRRLIRQLDNSIGFVQPDKMLQIINDAPIPEENKKELRWQVHNFKTMIEESKK